jgi:medium-chain acyl-[acyl-carrier-protein] hydrolase
VCFPYAGGTASVFRSWHPQLPGQVEVLAIRLPGRGERSAEPPLTEWHELVAPLSAALSTVLDGPFVFFGHSLGALIGFEVARWLRRHRGINPERLLVAGRRAPQVPDDEPPVSATSDEEFTRRLRELKGTPPEILEHAELFALVLPRLRADFKLGETYAYVPEPPLRCPITAFGGADDDETLEGKLDAWSAHTSGTFTTHLLPGDHFFLHSRECELLSLVGAELCRSLPNAVQEA